MIPNATNKPTAETFLVFCDMLITRSSFPMTGFLGEYFGKTYYGFFLIALFYVLLGIVIYLFRKQWIKTPVSNFIISQSLKEN